MSHQNFKSSKDKEWKRKGKNAKSSRNEDIKKISSFTYNHEWRY
jgi:hypothetical protein